MTSSKPPQKTNSISWGFIAAGFCSLLVAAYYDNIRGPLLPPMAAELHLAYEDSGWFLGIAYLAATVATLILLRALNRFSERSVMLVCTSVAFVAAGMATQVESRTTLMLLAVLVGTAVSNLGTMSNVLVLEGAPPALAGRYLSGLHAVFGIGSMIATSAVSVGLLHGIHWSTFYVAGSPLVLGLMALALTKLHRTGEHAQRTVQATHLSPLQILVIATFAVYVAAEVTGAVWMTSFLVNRGLAVDEAASYLTAYFLVLTLARLASAALITPKHERLILHLALAIPTVAYFIAHAGLNWPLVLVGLYGPFFPVFLSVVGRAFPDRWRSTTIWTVVCMNIMIGTFNVTLGRLADRIGIDMAYYVPLGLLILSGGLLTVSLRQLKTEPV